MKKTLCALLALVLALGLATIPVMAASYEGKLPLTDEKTTLTVFTHAGVNASYPPPSNDLPFWQYMEELTNVHIEWEIVPSESFEEIISTKLAAGQDLPDIIDVSTPVNAINAGKNGLLVNMAPLLEDNGYWTKALLEENAFSKALMTLEDGSMYAITATVVPKRNQIVCLYNKAWMEKIGAQIPTTTEEFLEVAKKMVGIDFNGNGKDDEIVLTSPHNFVFDSFSFSYGLELFESWDAFSADKDGVVYADYTCDKMKDYLTYLKQLYDAGVLDKEIFNADWNTFYEKVAADRVGIFVCYSSFATDCGNMTTAGKTAPNSEIYTIGVPLKGPYGDQYLVAREKGANDCTAITRDCKNPELAMRWLDTLFANPDVISTRYWGFEGKTYTVDANGNRTLLKPTDGTSWGSARNNLGCGQIPLAHQQTDLMFLEEENNAELSWWSDQDKGLDKYFVSPTIPHIAMTDAEQGTYDLYATDVNTYFREMQAKFVTGQESFDNWDKYVDTMKALGLDELVGVYQSIYDRTR